MKDDLPPKPLSVTIVGGFLGAGKTTLLSHVLRAAGARGLKIGVLVNDFGDVSIDAELIAEITGGVMRLTNGCICCTIKNDTTRALFRLMESHTLDHVLIETSGLSDPRAVAETFFELHKTRVIRFDGLISLVDADQIDRALGDQPALARAQIQAADLVVLSKSDLAGDERTRAAEEKVRSLAPRARVVRAVQGDVPIDVVLAIDAPLSPSGDAIPVHSFDDHEGHDHDAHPEAHGYSTWTFREARPLSWRTLAPLLTSLPPAVFRVKGLLNLEERPGDRILLHVVGGRVHVRTLEPWTGAPRTELVLIGSTGGFDSADLQRRLEGCATGG